MRSKKSIIICIIVIVIITILLVIGLTIGKERKESKNNMEVIRKNYQMLSESVNKYNEIRTKYSELTGVLVIDKFKDKQEELSTLMADYNKEIEKIDTYITNINLRCDGRIYNDGEITKVCNTYKDTYEKLINLYVGDAKNYNKIITEYNSSKNASLEEFVAIHKEYIDYNGDKNYTGGGILE